MISKAFILISCVLIVSARRSLRLPFTGDNVNRGFQDGTTLRSNTLQNGIRQPSDLLGISGSNVPIAGSGNDMVTYDIKTQPTCREIQRAPVGLRECGWNAGLSRNVDQFYLNGRIAAYKIQWEHGSWSEWYVPGVNDIDIKFNVQTTYCKDYDVRPNSMRRWWAYFNEYTHIVILCEDETKKI